MLHLNITPEVLTLDG